jgi:hypothetical protein
MASNLGADMNVTLCTAILAMPNGQPGGTLASVKCVQPTLGFGTSDAGKALPAFVQGRANLAGGIVRRLTTPRGQLIDVVTPSTTANYGTDQTELVNADLSVLELAMAGAGVDAELRKDERIVRSTTVATSVGGLLIEDVTVFDGAGPFKLVLAVSSVSTQLLTVPQ